jgi:hypothetical protein
VTLDGDIGGFNTTPLASVSPELARAAKKAKARASMAVERAQLKNVSGFRVLLWICVELSCAASQELHGHDDDHRHAADDVATGAGSDEYEPEQAPQRSKRGGKGGKKGAKDSGATPASAGDGAAAGSAAAAPLKSKGGEEEEEGVNASSVGTGSAEPFAKV